MAEVSITTSKSTYYTVETRFMTSSFDVDDREGEKSTWSVKVHYTARGTSRALKVEKLLRSLGADDTLGDRDLGRGFWYWGQSSSLRAHEIAKQVSALASEE